jgi:glycine/D-amino acid oxidase-like deaminating enzyme
MEARARIPVGPPVTNPLPSYWHNPKSPLANVIEPETSNPSKPYDYAIIGSGISGTMIAYNLLKAHPGSRIVMLEAREICGGATGRNGGHTKAASYRTYLQQKEEIGREEALRIVRLEYANIVETHALAKELGIECENEQCNTVDLIYDEETFVKGKAAIEELRNDAMDEESEWGKMAWYRVYEKESGLKQKFWAAEQNKNLQVEGTEALVGAFEYVAGRIHAYRFATGVLKQCVQKGLQLCANTPVHSILPSPAKSPSEPHLYDIFTQYTTITSHNVILATNGYTPYLLNSLQGAIVPLRGQITAQQPPATAKHPSVLPRTYSFIYGSGYEYMIPRPLPDGTQHIIIGGGLGRQPHGGANEFGTVDDSSLNADISKYLRASVSGYFGAPSPDEPSTEQPAYETVAEWSGIMGATADGRPFVGQVPGQKGLWISAGFNGHGMVLCLKSAEALVKMMDGSSDSNGVEWFPKSFLISGERLGKCRFQGRTDMPVPETGEGPVADG